MQSVAIFLGLVVAVLIALGLWRFLTQRSRGTTVLIRRLPASATHGWRHGSFRYEGELLAYYKLRSLAPTADHMFNRTHMSFEGMRELTEEEAGFIDPAFKVATIETNQGRFEIALDQRSLMALTAWIEAAPDIRQERFDPRMLRDRANRVRGERGRGERR